MSRLLLYTDLTPSWPWLFATVHANTALLAEHGITCAPFAPQTAERIPTHNFYWGGSVKEGEKIPPHVQNQLESLLQLLDTGKDVLPMGIHADLEAHMSLARLLQNNARFAAHNIKLLFRLGNPVCVLEQRFRFRFSPMPVPAALTIVRQFSCLCNLAQQLRQEWGKDMVTLLPDLAASPVPLKDNGRAVQLFAWLDCPAPALPEHTPLHYILLASWEGRRLALTAEVCYNAWPILNTDIFMDCVVQVEKNWNTGPVSPRRYRQLAIHEGAEDICALEELLSVPNGSLVCPEYLSIEKEILMNLLPYDKVAAFIDVLPQAERTALCQRFRNDAVLLTPDQNALAAALEAKGVRVDHVGEPKPPVSLTVLTMTCNHEKYIAQCMDSVLEQKTKFPVQHLVLDHHSQDDTPRIIAAYAERHTSIQPVLLSCRVPCLNVTGLFERCRTPYAALCDGDDYFTDPRKLQIQVDYLERNPDCAICAHPVLVVFEEAEHANYIFPLKSLMPRGFNAKYPIERLLFGNFLQTNTVVYRWRFTNGLPPWFRADITPGDWYWHMLHAELGLIGFLPKVMSAYRRHKKSLYYKTHESVLEHRKKYGMAELKTYVPIQ
ncbi:MAG: glycosyltransferase [Desulfovibrio sp.]|nr:glycosyltransferase [Desulfovibrio sp.]